jgi:uncharacterized protein (TIGR00288 family)
MKNSVAILWDAENVNPNQKEGLVEAVLEYIQKYGQLSVAAVFADWKKENLGNSDEIFSNNSFQLIHVPASRKNSADISLMTSGIEYLFIYPHIDTYVIVTGDVDFRPLLVSIRRRGCKTIIICDARNASENLLQIADEYFDYRTILDSGDSAGERYEPLSKEQCYSLLQEAIKSIKEKKDMANYAEVKVRMLLLNEKFNEKDIGLSSWRSFVENAEEEGIIKILSKDKNMYLEIPKLESKSVISSTDPFLIMLIELNELLKDKKDKKVLFNKLNEILIKKNFDIKGYGYSRFKKFLEDAEKRDLVKTESQGLIYYVTITDKGIKYIKK